jgi:GTP cyclohydrolase III
MAVERHVRICERLAGSLEFTIASAASRATTERLATERALVALWQSVSAIAADGDAMLRISAVEAAAQDSESRCCAAAAASAASVSYRRIEELQVRDACAGDLVRTHINEVVRFCP